jgi:hypothetical protein
VLDRQLNKPCRFTTTNLTKKHLIRQHLTLTLAKINADLVLRLQKEKRVVVKTLPKKIANCFYCPDE